MRNAIARYMVLSLIAGSLILAIAAAPIAAAEAWNEFISPDGYVSAIATDSIKVSGTQRTFRMKVGKVGDTHYAVAETTLDCVNKTLTMGNAELYDKGVQTGTKAADPAHPFTEPLGEEPSGDAILAFLCAA